MINYRLSVERLLIGISVLLLVGCKVQPKLIAAHAKTDTDQAEIVEVVLSAKDAKAIKDREMYFSIVVMDCENRENRFPIEPYVSGRLASDFDFPIVGEFVTLQGEIPIGILFGFQKLVLPCKVVVISTAS